MPHRVPRGPLLLLPALALTASLLAPLPAAQAKRPPAKVNVAIEAAKLQRIVNLDEPGKQMRRLEAFLREYPHPPGEADIYQLMIQDATALNDSRRVLKFNEKLQDLHPNDLGQRIKVLNLLLLESNPSAEARAELDAQALASLVATQAQSPPPDEVSAAAWQVDMNRLKAIAQMFLGAVAQEKGDDVAAAGFFRASLRLEPTEEAAAHLGTVLDKQGQTAAAVQADALALALPGQTIAERRALRYKAGKLYARLHGGSQRGFGDLILAQFDQIAAANARQQTALHPRAGRNQKAQTIEQFVLTNLAGQPRPLRVERGKVLVLDFWATWCGPCQAEHPVFEALKKKYAGDAAVRFVAINTDDDAGKVRPFLAAHHWGNGTLLDAGLANFLGIDSLPTTVVVAPDGRMVFRESGFDANTFAADVGQAIAYARTQRAAGVARAGR